MNKNITREIRLGDLFIAICQRWRFILVCLIIGAVIVGGVGMLKSGGTSKGGTEIVSDDAGLVARDKLSDERRQVVEITASSIKKYTELRDNQKKFNENSLYMQLDPYNLTTGELKYYIDNNQTTEWNNQLTALVQSYVASLSVTNTDDAMSQMLINIYDIDNDCYHYYKDLIYTDTNNQDSGLFSVKLYGDTAENVQSMADAVKTIISDNEEKIYNNIGEHTITMIGESIYKNFNAAVRDSQAGYSQVVVDYNTKITNLKATITDATEKTYLEYLLEDHDNVDAVETEPVAKTSSLTIKKAGMSFNIKYIGIGAILGIIVAIILIIIKYIATTTVKTQDEFESSLGMQVLARMDGESAFSKKHSTGFDKWLKKKKLKNRHRLSYEENIELIATKVEIAAKKNNMESVCIATDLDCNEKYALDVIAALEGRVNVTSIRNFLAKADALQNLSQTDGVVLIEQTEVSRYQDIIEELRICEKYDINVIGAIVLE